MHTKKGYPGKYEGNQSQMLASAAHSRVLSGCSDATIGDCSEIGWIADLVETKKYVYIVMEDGQGFVTVDYFKVGDPQAMAEWHKLETEYGSATEEA